ncbi:hypothetical protein CRE_06516 [Caenorhabditis remanei]|uniref:Uncharacterized protein n=1 Tax=Caenorhabditis remanei TaxID=31234 RepID=E3M1C5_CAERE|nr:hypothetical protein CRE_06516 [Caenorhabditis remanei]
MAPTSTRTGVRGGSRGGRGSGRGGNTVKEMEKKIRKLEKDLADYKFHYDALEKDANGVIRKLKKQVKKMDDEKKKLEEEIVKLIVRGKSGRVGNAEKSICKATQEIDDLKLKNETLENENNSQIQQNNLLQTQIAGVSGRNAELERETENLKEQNSAQAKRIEDLTMEVTQLHQSNGNLNDNLEESGKKIKILEKQHSELIAKNGILIREQEEAKRWWKQKLDELNERAEAIASATQPYSQVVQEDREFAHIRLLGQGNGYTMEAIHRLQHITEIVDSLHSVPQAPQNYNANHIVNISSRIPAERRVNLEFLVYMENRRRQQLGWWQRTRIAVENALNLIDPFVAPTPHPANAAPRQK